MLIDNDSDFSIALEEIEKHDTITVDTETTGLDWHVDLIVGVPVRVGHDEGDPKTYYFSFRHQGCANVSENKLRTLGNVLHSKTVRGYNYTRFDLGMWIGEGVDFPNRVEDVILAGHLLDENELNKLETRAALYLGGDPEAEESRLLDTLQDKFGTRSKGNLWRLPASMVAPYGENDVILTDELSTFYAKWLAHYQLGHIYPEVCEYALCLAEMKVDGMVLDMDYMERTYLDLVNESNTLLEKIQKAAGYRLNPGSPKQVCAYLGLESSSKEAMQWALLARPGDESILDILKWRKLKSYYNTYLNPFMKLSENGILHPDLNPYGTVTGRPTCKKPNVLNVPRGPLIRGSFVAPPGCYIGELDFSQAEMRVGCHYGQVTDMGRALANGEDIHGKVARDLDVPRPVAKNVNFSFLYGIGPEAFSFKYLMPVEEATRYLNDYNNRYPGFRRAARQATEIARTRGYVQMHTGRMRRFNANWTNPKDALNSMVQGGVGEMIRKAIVRIRKEIGVRMFLTIYDSILFYGEEGKEKEQIQAAKEIMEPQPWCSVPMRVDAKVGNRWGSLDEL